MRRCSPTWSPARSASSSRVARKRCGGYLEVQPGVVSVLADTAIRADDVDEAAAEEARKDAEHALANQTGDFDYGRASAQLAEAAAQLRTLQKMRNRAGRG